MGQDHFPNLPVGDGMGFSRGVMLLDDCEGTFTYIVGGTGGDDVHEYLAAAAFTGTNGLHLKTRTTAAAAGDIVTIYKYHSIPESGLLVIRARLASPDLTKVKSIQLGSVINSGAETYQALLKHSPNTPKTEYQTTAAAFVAIATMALPTVASAFIDFELVIDCLAKQYISVTWNGIRAKLPGIPLWDVGAAVARYGCLILSVEAIGAAAAEIYADNLYIGEHLES
jgi:hypothetical protein